MCGIAGLYNPIGASESYPETIRRMLAWIAHRGPDESGYFVDDRAALGTVRLSIIDLTSGSQPLCDESERYWICYNGELYNYKELREELKGLGSDFRTASDTEVVLKAWMQWREGALPKFNGAFAFAIYDALEGTFFLARDRYGKRPLFYTRHNKAYLFSSEMKAFFGCDGFQFETDVQQLSSIFTLWTPLPHQSGFANVQQIPMGAYAVLGSSGYQEFRYDELDFSSEPFLGSEEEAKQAVRGALDESVQLQLRSDVEVGIYLSGGLDSTIVTDLVTRKATVPVHTFSVEFEEASFDESSDQKEVSRYYDTRHASVRIADSDIPESFPAALFHAEIPVFRTAFVPMYLLSKAVQEAGVKVILSGEGADETFLGYNIFKETLLRLQWNEMDAQTRRERLGRIYPYLDLFQAENLTPLMGVYQQYVDERTPGLFSHEMRFQNGLFSSRLLNGKFDVFSMLIKAIDAEPFYERLTPIQKAQWIEFKTLLSGYLLSTQGERMGLAHGVENRCPFLDPNVVAFANTVNLKFDDGFDEKYILKKAFEGRIPQNIIRKNKQPYRAPDIASFSRYRPDYLELMLSERELEKMEYFNTRFCLALIRKIFKTPSDQVGVKENHAFIFLLSCALIHHTFIERNDLPSAAPSDLDCKPLKVVDRRRKAL